MAPPARSALVVGDSALMRIYVSAILKSAGFHVAEAANGFVAMDRLSERSFDLCIVDLDIPKSDGMTIFALTLTGGYRSPSPIIIGCTDRPNDPPPGVWADADALAATLAKPFKPEDLTRLIEAVFSSAKSPTRNRS